MATRGYSITLNDPSSLDSFVTDLNKILQGAKLDGVRVIRTGTARLKSEVLPFDLSIQVRKSGFVLPLVADNA